MEKDEPLLLKQWRADTPGCKERIHLNNAGAGLMPKPVLDAMTGHLELEAAMGGYEAEYHCRDRVEGTYRALATLLDAEAHQLALCSSATDAFNRALSAIPFHAGDVLITTEQDYASNQIAFLSLQRRLGVSVIRIPQRDGALDLDLLEHNISIHHPRLVAVTHVPTNSGLVQPVAEVGRLCREHDVLFLLDACQSVGQMPLSVRELQCDFLSATSRKFLRGPRGAGFLYVSQRALDEGLEPLMIDMRGADWVGKDHYLPRSDAKRFEDWEFNYALVFGTKAAVDYAMGVGLDVIQERVCRMAAYIREALREIPGASVLDEGQKLCGIVTVHFRGAQPEELLFKLREKKINTSISSLPYAWIDFTNKGVDWALRISPHYYNSFEEIDQALDSLKKMVPAGNIPLQ